MIEHSEFPWGPQDAPGLLTPLGVVGWVLAAALLLILMAVTMRGQGGGKGPRRRGDDSQLNEIYAHVLAAARYALRQDEFGVLKGADQLRRVIRTHLGGVLLAGGGLNKTLRDLGEAMGEGGKKPEPKPAKHDHPHGGDDRHGGHGDYGHRPEPKPLVVAEPAGATVAETVHGHSITVNIGGDVIERPTEPGHGGHGHGKPDHGKPGHDPHHHHDDKPLTLEQQLAQVRRAVRAFEVWWSDKPARMAELRAAHDDLTSHRKPDPGLLALLEEKR
ncbi:hypothetical protein [Caulobacter mirabilis]|uniref:Uncharacterized protein n=1 Tax=Caulobacter mirabilis TaxID=69666 RepID=A0A2D2AW92_9CAUL|nr:hypothetical protein [Caulobacter mirabilis]ATQ42241.1 hypothetical protein CSW64_07320 [Caulobacter mirabilis]